MVPRMPVAARDNGQASLGKRSDASRQHRQDFVAVGYGKRAARQEVALYVDDE